MWFVLLLLAAGAGACSHAPAETGPGGVNLPSPSASGQPRWKAPPAAYLAQRNLCIDRELARRDLNEFGDAKGTTYAQGAPQGVAAAANRYEYVLRRRPDIATVCTRSPAEPEP